MNYQRIYLSISGAFICSLACAVTPPASQNSSGFFLGLGGAYSMARVHYDLAGSLNANQGMPPTGLFSGAANSLSFKDQTISPELQGGYLHPMADSAWTWGVKLVYKQLKDIATETQLNLIAPSINTTDLLNMRTSYTNNEFLLPAIIGHSYKKGFIYLGGGPAIIKINHSIYNLYDSLSGYYIGSIGGLSDSKWLFGGTAHAGITYYLNPRWFLDLNYTYTSSGRFSSNNSASFAPATNGGLNSGTLFIDREQRLASQDVSVSINMVF